MSDDDIIAEIDRELSNVNLDKCWKKQIGDLNLWFSTVSYEHSNLAKKSLKEEFGLEETKRVTLSAAIVGFGETDLREYRITGKKFKVKGKDGKQVFLSLQEFIYSRIANWDAEFVDLAYDVFADLMASHNKDLSKNIVFENARTPLEELEELEERAADMRRTLGLPPLVEAQRLADAVEEASQEAPPEEEPVRDEAPAPSAADVDYEGAEEDFDPFQAVKRGAARVARPAEPAASDPDPEPVRPPREDVSAMSDDEELPFPKAGASVPVPTPPPAEPRTPSAIESAMAARSRSTPLAPGVPTHVAQPSVPSEVIEKPAAVQVVQPPRFDPKASAQSRNPRFRRTAP